MIELYFVKFINLTLNLLKQLYLELNNILKLLNENIEN